MNVRKCVTKKDVLQKKKSGVFRTTMKMENGKVVLLMRSLVQKRNVVKVKRASVVKVKKENVVVENLINSECLINSDGKCAMERVSGT